MSADDRETVERQLGDRYQIIRTLGAGAFGLGGWSFTWLYDTFPPFRAFRAPGRFSTVIGLYVCLLAGLGLQRLLGRSPGRGRKAAAAAETAAHALARATAASKAGGERAGGRSS